MEREQKISVGRCGFDGSPGDGHSPKYGVYDRNMPMVTIVGESTPIHGGMTIEHI